jgi:hypothetical protein
MKKTSKLVIFICATTALVASLIKDNNKDTKEEE